MTELSHGTISTYQNHKCKCAACRKAWADYRRQATARYRQEGKCSCSRPVKEGRTYCEACLKRQRDCQRKRRQKKAHQREAA